MRKTETDLLRLALTAYEAAAEPELWPRFLESYNDAVSSDIALLQVHDFDANKSTLVSSFGMTLPFSQSYNEYYSKRNVWRERGRALYAEGAVNLDQEQCPRSVLERSEFYNDYILHLRVAHSMGGVIARRRNRFPTLTSLRNHRKGEFGEDARRITKFLLPHLTRAWTVFERLELLAAGESVLENMPIGIAFLGAGGDVLYANNSAENIFRSADGLSSLKGVPRAWGRKADALLRKSMDHASSLDKPMGPHALAIPRPSGRRAYQVVVAPLRTRYRQFASTHAPVVVVFITDPELPAPAKRDLLIQLYGLTPKEAQLTAKLSEGKSVEQSAGEMRITYETARTHLRRIFSKTGTSRQGELLLLLARLPGTELG